MLCFSCSDSTPLQNRLAVATAWLWKDREAGLLRRQMGPDTVVWSKLLGRAMHQGTEWQYSTGLTGAGSTIRKALARDAERRRASGASS